MSTETDLPAKMALLEIQTYIGETERNASLYEEKNFDKRVEVIDFIGFGVIDQIEYLLQETARPDKLMQLKYRTEKLKSELEKIDSTLFQKLQAGIWAKEYIGDAFKNLVSEYVDFKIDFSEQEKEADYDNLDIFINGLLPIQTMPEQTIDLEPEMVYYQKTPARIVFDLVEKTHFTKEDVFFDLGSGLGQVAILVHLLTGITAKGIEFEPAFYKYAGDCAAELNLSQVTFINADARKADYSDGTVFFMFTPFRGDIMQEVLALLQKEALHRKITIITYGPCTPQVALQSWLNPATPGNNNIYQLGFFSSFS